MKRENSLESSGLEWIELLVQSDYPYAGVLLPVLTGKRPHAGEHPAAAEDLVRQRQRSAPSF